MALQPVTTTWQQADVDAMVMDGSWLVRCGVCVMCKWREPTVVSAIRWIPISCELNSAALQAADRLTSDSKEHTARPPQKQRALLCPTFLKSD